MALVRTLFAAALALGIGVTGCSTTVEDEPDTDGQTAEAFTDSRSATVTEWGSELFVSQPDGRPNGAWPGVFNQPAMKSGPGSCGFAAIANVSTQLLSRSGAPTHPVTPWDALSRQNYNTILGIYPSNAIKMLDALFADRALAGDLQGTKFAWSHEGVGNYDGAWARLHENLDAGHPFIALVNYGQDGAPSYLNCSRNHYVVVVAVNADESVVIAHRGTYETVAKWTFLKWWENHCVYSFSGIYPNSASRLGQSRSQ
jgi:hypothetical protein